MMADVLAAAWTALAELDAVQLVSTLLLVLSYPAEVAVAALAVATVLPPRANWGRRLAGVAAAYAVGSILIIPASYAAGAAGVFPLPDSVGVLLGAIVLMLSSVVAIMLVFEASPWQALFCATAGWACQNLASGVEGTASLVAERLWGISFETGSFPLEKWLSVAQLVLLAVVFSVVYTVCYRVFVRRVRAHGLGEVEDRRMLAVLVLVVAIVIVFDMANKELDRQGVTLEVLLVLRAIHAAVCVFVLFTEYEMLHGRSLETQVALDRQMAAERERQWQLSQENREAINVKCHDIRHQIRVLADSAGATVDQGFLEGLAREVDVYDSLFDTGNNALDTILSEKALVCEREAIELSCIADGSALGFMEPAEIYALFGNALDNAMRATREVDDPDRRSISLTVRRRGELACIHVENYFVAPEGGQRFEDGLPQTTQAGPDHGFGTRSMRGIVERRGGTLAFGTRGDVFTLDAMIPVPEA